MKKLLPLALVAMLAACATDNQGHPLMWWQDGGTNWGHCDHCWGSAMPLSERNFGAVRGAHHEVFEHNDVVANGYYYNAPMDGAYAHDGMHHGKHHHWVKKTTTTSPNGTTTTTKTSK